MNVKMLWKAWHGDEVVELSFPNAWDIEVLRMSAELSDPLALANDRGDDLG